MASNKKSFRLYASSPRGAKLYTILIGICAVVLTLDGLLRITEGGSWLDWASVVVFGSIGISLLYGIATGKWHTITGDVYRAGKSK